MRFKVHNLLLAAPQALGGSLLLYVTALLATIFWISIYFGSSQIHSIFLQTQSNTFGSGISPLLWQQQQSSLYVKGKHGGHQQQLDSENSVFSSRGKNFAADYQFHPSFFSLAEQTIDKHLFFRHYLPASSSSSSSHLWGEKNSEDDESGEGGNKNKNGVLDTTTTTTNTPTTPHFSSSRQQEQQQEKKMEEEFCEKEKMMRCVDDEFHKKNKNNNCPPSSSSIVEDDKVVGFDNVRCCCCCATTSPSISSFFSSHEKFSSTKAGEEEYATSTTSTAFLAFLVCFFFPTIKKGKGKPFSHHHRSSFSILSLVTIFAMLMMFNIEDHGALAVPLRNSEKPTAAARLSLIKSAFFHPYRAGRIIGDNVHDNNEQQQQQQQQLDILRSNLSLTSSATCGVQCWLEHLDIHIPDQTFSKDTFDFLISGMECNGITLGSIDSKFVPPLSLAYDIEGVGATCTMDWSAHEPSFPYASGHGSVTAEVSGSSGKVQLELLKDKDGLANAAKVTDCQNAIYITNLKITGTLHSAISLLEKMLNGKIERELNTVTCNAFTTAIEKNLTAILQQIDDDIRPYLSADAEHALINPTPHALFHHSNNNILSLDNNSPSSPSSYKKRAHTDSTATTTTESTTTTAAPATTPAPTTAPSSPPSSSSSPYVVLEGNSIVGVLVYILDHVVGANGPIGLNYLVDRFTNNTGRLSLADLNITKLPAVTLPLGPAGNVTMQTLSLEISGLNTWRDFDVLRPIGPQLLDSKSTLEYLDVNITFGINATAGDTLVHSGAGSLYEEGRIMFSLRNASLDLQTLVDLKAGATSQLAANQFTCIPCVLGILQQLNISSLNTSLAVSRLSITAMGDGTDTLAIDIDNAIDSLLSLITDSFSPAIPAFISGIVSGPGRSMVNDKVSEGLHYLDTTTGPCVDPTDPDFVGFNVSVALISFISVVVIGVMLIVFQYCFSDEAVQRRQRANSCCSAHSAGVCCGEEHEGERCCDACVGANEAADTLPQHDRIAAPNFSQGENLKTSLLGDGERKEANNNNNQERCLFFHHSVATAPRLLVPILILINIGLFVTSNNSTGAGVAVYITAEGATLITPSLFDFTLSNSVRDMWEAGVYPLSCLIAVFSGAWPYMKLVMLLMAWFIPARILSDRRRELILMVLDAMGKWSMIDAYVLTLMAVAFNFHIPSPAVPQVGTPQGAAEADVHVLPEFGFYSFMVATMLSLVLTHTVLAFHRRATSSGRRGQLNRLEARGPKEPLCLHAFRVGRRRLRCTLLGRILVTLSLLISLGLLGAGVTMTSFAFDFGGLLGPVLTYINQPTHDNYSIITLGAKIPQCATDDTLPGMLSIMIVYFLFVLIMPILFLCSLLLLWLTPLKPRTQRYLFIACEIFNAWAGLEVFVVSIVAALVELRQFAQFIIGDKCDLINVILDRYFSAELGGNTLCFDVTASLEPACWILFGACFIYLVVGSIVLRLCHKVLEEREDKAFMLPEIITSVDSSNTNSYSVTGADYSSAGPGPNDPLPVRLAFPARLFLENAHRPVSIKNVNG